LFQVDTGLLKQALVIIYFLKINGNAFLLSNTVNKNGKETDFKTIKDSK
jgi:hypothetical protein